MQVTDDQIAALRAQLTGDYDEHRRLLGVLNSAGELRGYTAVVTAAFIEAVDRKFTGPAANDAAIISFVGQIRSRFTGADEEIDPSAAERVIQKARGQGSISDIDATTIRKTEALLLPLMVADLGLDSAGVDRLLADARKLIGG